MSCVQATNTAGEVEQAVPVDIFNHSALALRNENWRCVIRRAHDSFLATLHQGLRSRTGNRRAELD
jgi:hypothetical protein